mmetsp:Transcript_2127/g.6346  ORF Transcript_2127/g.6346 Transcript_2127/m.6346 type:complete len:225 (+) Transcript_2127:1769-2443(+)
MEMVSITVGWSTRTCWKRLSNAASFSIYFRYSSRVVAPMQRSSPRASIGFKRLPASIAPSVFPAPTTVWISSMKRMTFPSADVTSFRTAFKRSSNSPLYFAPAINEPMSSAISLRPCSDVGTSFATILCARPSAMAVLPTPGSPSRTGLFFVRLDKIWMVRLISSSRPITGSSFFSRAAAVRSRPYLFSASKVPSGVFVVTFFPARISLTAFSRAEKVSPVFVN